MQISKGKPRSRDLVLHLVVHNSHDIVICIYCNMHIFPSMNICQDVYTYYNFMTVMDNKISMNICRGACGWGEGVYRVLLGKPEGRRPLGRPRRRWEDNIRMDLQDVGCGCMDWIELAQDRDRWRTLVNVVMNLRVPWNAGNFLTSCKPVSFSRRTLHHGVSK